MFPKRPDVGRGLLFVPRASYVADMPFDISVLVKLLRRKSAQMRRAPSAVVHVPTVELREPIRRAQIAPHKPADDHRLRSSQM